AIVGATATARRQCLEKIDSAMSHLRNGHSSPKRLDHVLKTYAWLLLQEQGRSTGNHGRTERSSPSSSVMITGISRDHAFAGRGEHNIGAAGDRIKIRKSAFRVCVARGSGAKDVGKTCREYRG